MTYAEMVALDRAHRTVADVRATLELRRGAPPHVLRGWGEDCQAVVELKRDHVCHCGSRSVVPSRPRRIA